MPKQVIYAQLHDVFFIPGEGQFTNTLPPNSKNLKNFKMTLQDSGQLLLEWEKGGYTQSFTIAAAALKGAQHAPVKLEAPKVSK